MRAEITRYESALVLRIPGIAFVQSRGQKRFCNKLSFLGFLKIIALLLPSIALATSAIGADDSTAKPVLQDKTLVVWVSPANLAQRSGSALTIDDGESHFDGIIFGEITPKKWMPGSDNFSRSSQEQTRPRLEPEGHCEHCPRYVPIQSSRWPEATTIFNLDASS